LDALTRPSPIPSRKEPAPRRPKALHLLRAGYPARGEQNTRGRSSRGEEAQPMEYVGFDAHKHYTLASVAQADGRLLREEWIERERGRSRPSWRAASSDETGRCAGGDPRPSEAHDERDGGRGPGPRQCLEEDRLSTLECSRFRLECG